MKSYPCEYRCIGCKIRVGIEKPAELFCIPCQKILQRWK